MAVGRRSKRTEIPPKMESRTLGRNGPFVSRIGLGMAALGRPGYINLGHGKDLGAEVGEATMEIRAHSLLDTAFSSGIRYFDVARSYGLGERFLGRWLTKRGHRLALSNGIPASPTSPKNGLPDVSRRRIGPA